MRLYTKRYVDKICVCDFGGVTISVGNARSHVDSISGIDPGRTFEPICYFLLIRRDPVGLFESVKPAGTSSESGSLSISD